MRRSDNPYKKGAKINLAIPGELKERMSHVNCNWSAVAKIAFEQVLDGTSPVINARLDALKKERERIESEIASIETIGKDTPTQRRGRE